MAKIHIAASGTIACLVCLSGWGFLYMRWCSHFAIGLHDCRDRMDAILAPARFCVYSALCCDRLAILICNGRSNLRSVRYQYLVHNFFFLMEFLNFSHLMSFYHCFSQFFNMEIFCSFITIVLPPVCFTCIDSMGNPHGYVPSSGPDDLIYTKMYSITRRVA